MLIVISSKSKAIAFICLIFKTQKESQNKGECNMSTLKKNSEITLLESKHEAQHMRPASYDQKARLTWGPRPNSLEKSFLGLQAQTRVF